MTASNVKDASFYADFGSLSALKRDARVNDPAALRAAAQQFESLFTNMMLKSMRAASFGDALTGSSDVDFYQGMFDQQLAVQMSKGKGMGLADMLVQQLGRSGLVRPTPDRIDKVPDASTGSATGVPVAEPVEASGSTIHVPQPSAVPSWPPATPEEFVQALLPHAQTAAKQLGVDPATLVAHAALETGWGKHVPCNSDGSSSFNLFGIKATTAWQGRSTGATTLEYEQGAAVKRVERFKAYESPADCFNDYAGLLDGQRYDAARNTGGNVAQFAQSLQQGGYATDPQYANKLRAVAVAVRSIQAGAIAQVDLKSADI